MALVGKFQQLKVDRNQVHGEVQCTYSVFSDDTGNKYLQIDTYGSASRELKGKKSQSVQFGPEAIKALKDILNNI